MKALHLHSAPLVSHNSRKLMRSPERSFFISHDKAICLQGGESICFSSLIWNSLSPLLGSVLSQGRENYFPWKQPSYSVHPEEGWRWAFLMPPGCKPRWWHTLTPALAVWALGAGVPPRDPGTQGCMLPCVLSHHLGIKNGPSEAFLKHSESVCIALPALKASEHYGIQSPRTTEETGWCCPSSRLGQTTNSCMVNYGSLPFSFSLDNLSFRNKR